MIFSERYKDFIYIEYGEYKDSICGDIEYRVKQRIENVIKYFHEPITLEIDRYTHDTEKSNVVLCAIDILTDKIGHSVIQQDVYAYTSDESSYNIASTFTPYLFDLIEIMYDLLSDDEKTNFCKTLNETLNDCDVPWLLVDGRMIKIDAKQFECDLKAKALDQMKVLMDAEPIFQSAYTELMSAIESLEKQDYQSAINNAGKSYESVLKVITSEDKGNADKLTTQYMNDFLLVPETMRKPGFREKVMMSLPFIRNNSGANHGAGASEVVISRSMANLAVNLAASLNTFLIEEYKNNESKEA